MKKLLFALLLSLIPLGSAVAELDQFSSSTNADTEDANLISPLTKVDYSSLAKLLAAGKWRQANDETTNLLLEATGRRRIGWAQYDDIRQLSCWDLRTIDNLWKRYSDGHFGFSVQLPIFLATGNRPGKLVSDRAFLDFGDRLGWRENDDWIIFIEDLNFSIDAPIGHLPNPRPEYSITGGRLQYVALAQRMVECNIANEDSSNIP